MPSRRAADAASGLRTSLPVMLWRGARWRCAWCGGRRAFFTGWFRKTDRCRTCGIEWRRGYEGFELGAATVNTILTFGILVAAMVAGLVATWPDVAVVPLLAVLGAAAVVVPTAAYPISYTLWQAIDLAMRPPEPGEAPDPASIRGGAAPTT